MTRDDRHESLAGATRRCAVQVTASGMRQQVCGHAGCTAQRLSRPSGQGWRPCWHKTPSAPIPLDPHGEVTG